MALVNNTQLTTLATDFIDNVGYSMSPAGRTASITKMKAYLQRLFDYVAGGAGNYNANKGFLEVNGVTAGLDAGSRTIESYTSGVGINGGALSSATGGPVSGNVIDAKADTSSQNNSGTGLVK